MEQQAAQYLVQQSVAVVVCCSVAVVFGLAIRKLFQDAKEERAAAAAALASAQIECRAERAADRSEWMGALEGHAKHLEAMGDRLQDNTRALDRITDRLAAQSTRAA